MRSAWFALVLLAVEAFTERARAEGARFVWQGPHCGSSAARFERRVVELVESHDRERLTGSVSVTRARGHYNVEVTIHLDGRRLGTRHFETKDCARAAETAAVAASLSVYAGDGEQTGAAASGISPDIWTRHPEPMPDFSEPLPPPEAREQPVLKARLGLLGVLELGALPKPAWGGALELGLGVGKRWSFALLGCRTAEQRRQVRERELVLLSTSSGAGRVCLAPLLGDRYRLDGCAGVQVMQAHGRGQGFDVNRSASLTWAAPLLGIGFSVQAPRYLEWRGELEGSLPLARRRFLVDGSEVSRPTAVVAAIRIGAALRF
ncbi:MAG TPA: hypothetical protein VJN18_06410 [Polyangiaceae bacterium]|nr:hypothetical protein [Polyangiaceae bacterium]